MNSIPLISNMPVVNFSMNRGNASPEVQMRQEINTSLVALKKEAGTLEGLINEASQILDEVNNRIATLENDTVKKSDIVDVVQSGNMNPVTSDAVADKINSLDVSSVGGSGKYISAISETDGKISATVSDLTSVIESGNNQPATSGGVHSALYGPNIASDVFTVTASWIANHTTDIRRLGNFLVCNIFVQVTTAQTLSSDTKIATLSLKPQSYIRVLGAVESTGAVIKAEIRAQGELIVAPFSGSVSVSGYIRFESIIFPIATS